MDNEYLTPEEVATKLQVHIDTIRRWLRTGELPGMKIGKRQWRIRKTDIERYLSDQRVQSGD
jgi:excisionase family DNA binding protein